MSSPYLQGYALYILRDVIYQHHLKHRFILSLQFGDSKHKDNVKLVRILRSNVMVRVGGGWEELETFLEKHDPCRGI